jgi:transposase
MGFVSEALVPGDDFIDSAALSAGEPPLPRRFRWQNTELEIASVVRTWRSTNTDRGDVYLARHWFEVKTTGERIAVIYFDRKAKRGGARWWLYTIDS